MLRMTQKEVAALRHARAGKAPPKYRNKPTEVDGIKFPSKREARRWGVLKLMAYAGAISKLQRQVRYPLVVNGEKVGTYVADFVYEDRQGATVVEDAKGMATPVYRLKRKLMQAIHRITISEV